MTLPTAADPKKINEKSVEASLEASQTPAELEDWEDSWFAKSGSQTTRIESTTFSNLRESTIITSQAVPLIDFIQERVVNTFSEGVADAQPTPDYNAPPFKVEDTQPGFKPFWTEVSVTGAVADTSKKIISETTSTAIDLGKDTISSTQELLQIIRGSGEKKSEPEDPAKQAEFQFTQNAQINQAQERQNSVVRAKETKIQTLRRWIGYVLPGLTPQIEVGEVLAEVDSGVDIDLNKASGIVKEKQIKILQITGNGSIQGEPGGPITSSTASGAQVEFNLNNKDTANSVAALVG